MRTLWGFSTDAHYLEGIVQLFRVTWLSRRTLRIANMPELGRREERRWSFLTP